MNYLINEKRHTNDKYDVLVNNTDVTTKVYLPTKTVVTTVDKDGNVQVSVEPPPEPLIVIVNN